jgi:PST family polysaccharide transporter
VSGVDNKQGESILEASLWLLTSSAAQSLLKVGVTAILARLLTPEDFGIIAAVMAVVNLANMLNGAGTGSYLVQSPSVTQEHFNTIFTYSLIAGIATAIVITILRSWISNFFSMPLLDAITPVVCFIFLFQALYRVAYSYLQRNLLFKRLAGLEILSYLISYGLLGISLAFFGYGVWSLVWSAVAQSAIYALLLNRQLPIKLRLGLNLSVLPEALRTGGGYTAINFLSYAARNIDYWVVGKMMGATSLGYYSRAFNLMTAPHSIFGSALSKILFAKFARMQGDDDSMIKTLKRTVAVIFFLGVPLSTFCIVAAHSIVLLLLGAQWTLVVTPFQILSVAMIAKVGIGLILNYLLGAGLLRNSVWFYFWYSVFVFLGTWLGAATGNLNLVSMGVAFGLLLSFGIILIKSLTHAGISLQFPVKHLLINLVLVSPFVLVSFLVSISRFFEGKSFLLLLVFHSVLIILIYGFYYRTGIYRLLGSEIKWLVEVRVRNLVRHNLSRKNA